jgi:DinB family protein
MEDAEKQEIQRVLGEGMDALDDALRGLDEETARMRPHPESWSVVECVEHLSLAEAGLLSRLREAKPAEGSHEDRAREAKFQELALNRLRRIEAPEPAIPMGEQQTLEHAWAAFKAIRCETLCYVEDFDGNLRAWLTVHPLITRAVNCYEMLLLMALHPRRHAQQIVDIREQLSLPRSQIE